MHRICRLASAFLVKGLAYTLARHDDQFLMKSSNMLAPIVEQLSSELAWYMACFRRELWL